MEGRLEERLGALPREDPCQVDAVRALGVDMDLVRVRIRIRVGVGVDMDLALG